MASEGRDEQRLAGRRAAEWPSRRVTKVGTELSHHWTQPLHHPPLFSNTSGDAHCLPGQPIPMHHSPFGGETIPTTQPNPTQPPNAQLKAVASRLIATDPPSPPPPKKKFGAPFKRAQDPGTMRPRSTTATEGGKKDPLVEHPPPPAAAHLRARGRARCSLPLSPPLSPPPNGSAARPRRPGAWTEGMDAAAGVGGGPGAVHRRLSAPRRGAAGPQRRPRCRPPAPAPTAAAMVRLHAGRAPLTGAGRAEGREH